MKTESGKRIMHSITMSVRFANENDLMHFAELVANKISIVTGGATIQKSVGVWGGKTEDGVRILATHTERLSQQFIADCIKDSIVWFDDTIGKELDWIDFNAWVVKANHFSLKSIG